MSGRYQVRMFESMEKDGATAAGTVLTPMAQTFSVYAESADEADKLIRRDITTGKRPRGKVYQILPVLGNAEFARSLAVSTEGSFDRVFLDPASGPYSEFRRIRLAEIATEAA